MFELRLRTAFFFPQRGTNRNNGRVTQAFCILLRRQNIQDVGCKPRRFTYFMRMDAFRCFHSLGNGRCSPCFRSGSS